MRVPLFRLACWCGIAGIALPLSSCDTGEPAAPGSSTLVVRARVVQPAAKCLDAAQTTWDSLVVRVVTGAGDTLRSSMPLGPDDAVVSDTLSSVPAEDNLSVDAYTVDRSGHVVHRADPQVVDLEPGQTSQVSLWLNAVSGSIYIELIDVPTSVATIQACFAYDGDTLCAQTARATRVFLAIDYVPDAAGGTLAIAGVGPDGDTLYRSEMSLTFYSDRYATVSASFTEEPGGMALEATVVAPAVTVVAGSMGASVPPDTERGPLILSEVMYAANYAEYVELHNPTASALVFDSLVLEKDGVRRYLLDVAVAPGGFFVVARNDSPWADTSLSLLDLSSTTGNWVSVLNKSLEVMDWVAYAGGSNDVGWPNPGSSAAIVLDSLPENPAYNNYGTHWTVAQSSISGGTQRGTPGTAGQ